MILTPDMEHMNMKPFVFHILFEGIDSCSIIKKLILTCSPFNENTWNHKMKTIEDQIAYIIYIEKGKINVSSSLNNKKPNFSEPDICYLSGLLAYASIRIRKVS